MKIVISGDKSKEFILQDSQSSVTWVESGSYVVTAYAAPNYNQIHRQVILLMIPSEAKIIVLSPI